MIVWEPTGRLAVLKEAVPPESVTLPRSSPVVVSKKSTLPVGVPEPGALAVTVAVKVTAWPKLDVLADGTTLVVVLSLLTVWVSVPVLARKMVFPL